MILGQLRIWARATTYAALWNNMINIGAKYTLSMNILSLQSAMAKKQTKNET